MIYAMLFEKPEQTCMSGFIQRKLNIQARLWIDYINFVLYTSRNKVNTFSFSLWNQIFKA